MSEKIGSRVYNEARMQIDGFASQAIQNKFGNQQHMGMMGPGFYQEPANEIANDLKQKKEYELYGKLTAYGNGNAVWGIQSVARKQTVFGMEEVYSDITSKEKERIVSEYAAKSKEQKTQQTAREVFKAKVDTLASSAKLELAAATTIEDIKSIVEKFRSDINKIK